MSKYSKIFIFLSAAVITIAFLWLMIPVAKLLYTEEGRLFLDAKVKSFGPMAPLAFVAIEIIQIVAAVIPGAPIEVMSGVLFGSVWGVVWCFIGIFTGTSIVFFLVRKFGRPLINKLFPKIRLDNISILNDESKLTLAVFILFAIPGTPKDFLTYIAGLTDIKPLKFFFVASAARTPSMACSVFMGANIGEGRFLISIIMFAVILLLSLIGLFVRKKLLGKSSAQTD